MGSSKSKQSSGFSKSAVCEGKKSENSVLYTCDCGKPVIIAFEVILEATVVKQEVHPVVNSEIIIVDK